MNTLNNTNDFSNGLVFRAQQRLIDQGDVPKSPGITCGRRTHLCAGAVVVREAVALRQSEEAAEHFEHEVVAHDSGYIRNVGCEIGLDGEMVSKIILMSDGLPAHTRLAGMLAYLDHLRL